jgi:hypothetical protein
MMGDLPFSLDLTRPPGWRRVPPDAVGEPAAAYVAVREANIDEPVTPNVVIGVTAMPTAAIDVIALAEAHLARLRATYPVTVLSREAGGRAGPQAAQLLQIDYTLDEVAVTLKQVQILIVGRDTTDPALAGVIELIMTCPEELFEQAGPEFQELVASIQITDTATT